MNSNQNDNKNVSEEDNNIVDECCICLELLQGELAEISCGHIYHYDCIKNWISNKRKLRKLCCICEKDTEIVNIFYNMSTYSYKKPEKIENYDSIVNLDIYDANINNNQTNIIQNENQPIINQENNQTYRCCIIL